MKNESNVIPFDLRPWKCTIEHVPSTSRSRSFWFLRFDDNIPIVVPSCPVFGHSRPLFSIRKHPREWVFKESYYVFGETASQIKAFRSITEKINTHKDQTKGTEHNFNEGPLLFFNKVYKRYINATVLGHLLDQIVQQLLRLGKKNISVNQFIVWVVHTSVNCWVM